MGVRFVRLTLAGRSDGQTIDINIEKIVTMKRVGPAPAMELPEHTEINFDPWVNGPPHLRVVETPEQIIDAASVGVVIGGGASQGFDR